MPLKLPAVINFFKRFWQQKPLNKGQAAEQQACLYLQKKGLKLIQKNFFCKMGEIDLIMQEGAFLVFIEVRYRTTDDYGTPSETVGKQKQRRLIKTASLFLIKNKKFQQYPARFDVVAIKPDQIEWIKQAFLA